MTLPPPGTLARRLHVWRTGHPQDWPIITGLDDPDVPPGYAYNSFVVPLFQAAIVMGSAVGADLVRHVPAIERDLAYLEAEAAAGQLSWHLMTLVNVVGAFAAVGASGTERFVARLAPCLPSISTSRNDERVHYHWNRGLAAVAADVPAIYRPMSGHEMRAPLRFVPGARFEMNIQGLLGHLAGAVEQRAALADCEPAWHETLANFRTLERAQFLDSASLVWMAIILHHRVAGQPLGTAADYLRDSVERVAAAGG